MGIHAGHRERVKKEFLSGGLNHFPDIRALELLLFYSRLQGDVNELAHTLIDTFGSLSGVFDADPDLLRKVPGVGENTAILIKLIPALSAKYLSSRLNDDMILDSSQNIHALFASYFFAARNELSFLACLDGKLKLLGVRKLSEGIPNATDIVTRTIASAALSLNATTVILAHNHISNFAQPSQTDLTTTTYLRDFLSKMGITLYDHVILVDDDMVSLRETHPQLFGLSRRTRQ